MPQFQVILTSAYNFPDHRHGFIPYAYAKENVLVHLMAILKTTSTPAVRDLTVAQRKCVYKDEMELDVSNVYSPSACKLQCEISDIMKTCKCYLPNYYNSGT